MNPKHIACIMDGNRRWAVQQGLPKLKGHSDGAENLRRIVRSCSEMKIPYLTVWALSTENVKNRTEKELKHLFALLKKLPSYLQEFIDSDVRIQTIGDLSRLPEDVQTVLENMKRKTSEHAGLTLTLAINYGGRDELIRAMQRMLSEQIAPATLREDMIAPYLDTAGMPDPDLIIRTGGHKRLSGYLPWQSTYAELYFTNTYWPAFSPEELTDAIEWFKAQQRNHGK